MVTLLQTVFFFSVGVACVYSGLMFITGQLFPGFLEPLYKLVPAGFWRVLFSSVTLLMAANFFNSKGYVVGGQALGGPVYVIFLMVGMVLTALLVDRLMLNWHVFGGMALLCLGGLWVIYGLSQG